MRIILLFIALFVAVIGFSCENELHPKDCSNIILLAGDTVSDHLTIIELDTLLFHNGKPDTVFYYVDIDLNDSYEFKITSFFDYSPAYYEGAFHIATSSSESKILLNSSLENPEILEINDTIDLYHNAYSGRYEMVKCVGHLNPATGEESHSCTGIWKNIDQKYIGLVYEDGNYIYNCWLKIGLIGPGEPFGPHSIFLYDIGILKCCL